MNLSSIAPGLGSAQPREIGWAVAFAVGAIAYFIFSSPFASNRELRNRWPTYLYVIMFVHGIIALSVLVHLPISARWTPTRLQVPHAFFVLSALLTVVVMGIFDALFRPARAKLAYFNGFQRSLAENMASSAFVAALCALVYARCHDGAVDAAHDALCSNMGENQEFRPLGLTVSPVWRLWLTWYAPTLAVDRGARRPCSCRHRSSPGPRRRLNRRAACPS